MPDALSCPVDRRRTFFSQTFGRLGELRLGARPQLFRSRGELLLQPVDILAQQLMDDAARASGTLGH